MSTLDILTEDEIIGGKVWPWWGKLILWCVLTFFLTVSSCTVLTSIDDAAVTAVEAELLKVKYIGEAAAAQDKLALEKQRLMTLERLVTEHGYGPVSARCAVEGWATGNTREACERANALHAAGKK